MGKWPLVITGIVVAATLVAGAGVTALVLLAEPSDARQQQALSPAIPRPADRYNSRGILPLETDPELGSIEVYLVGPDGTLHPPPHGLRQEIWDLAVRVMTPEGAGTMLESYKVGNNQNSDRTAWVREHGERDGEWNLGVNLATSSNPTQLAATLVHEYAHLLSLRPDQVVPLWHECTTVVLPEGCARTDSYIHAFDAEFWAPHGLHAPVRGNTDPAAARAFYASNPGEFVSEYAAMNLSEDFAESFAAFVHSDVIGDEYAGKLAFFSHFAEMVEIRERIRADLDGILGSFRLG